MRACPALPCARAPPTAARCRRIGVGPMALRAAPPNACSRPRHAPPIPPTRPGGGALGLAGAGPPMWQPLWPCGGAGAGVHARPCYAPRCMAEAATPRISRRRCVPVHSPPALPRACGLAPPSRARPLPPARRPVLPAGAPPTLAPPLLLVSFCGRKSAPSGRCRPSGRPLFGVKLS